MNRRGSYWVNLLKGLDYGLAPIFGIPAGIYISSYVLYKAQDGGCWLWFDAVDFINLLFGDKDHCFNSLKHNSQDIQYYYGE